MISQFFFFFFVGVFSLLIKRLLVYILIAQFRNNITISAYNNNSNIISQLLNFCSYSLVSVSATILIGIM